MDMITSFSGPNPGDARPGNLYADLGSRTLWLGVEAAVDPAQAVLISDIVGLQADIDQTLLDAKAYTDTRILTRSPTGHTHLAADITNFTAAVTAVVAAAPGINWVRGMIMQYSGSLADIGVGGLAGWNLCDGSNGTPDLRDKFVLGAGSRAVGSVNAPSFDTTAGGGHTHTVNGTALTVANLPSHAHSGATATENANHTHGFSGVTNGRNAAHTHGPATLLNANGGGTPVGGLAGGSGVFYRASDSESADHAHGFSGTTSTEQQAHAHGITAEGGGQAHTHTLVGGGGAHAHTITAAQLREAIPFYALAFIMKL